MASPQTEDGFTRIANELLEALAQTRIPGRLRQVLDVIIRQTYGWNKKAAEISLAEFQKRTGLGKTHICGALSTLLKMHIITKNGNASKVQTITKNGNAETATYGIQKDFRQWEGITKNGNVTKNGNTPLPKTVTPLYKVLKKKEKRKSTLFLEVFPEAFQNSEAFKTAWLLWLKHRKENRHPIRETTAQAQARKLSKHTPETAAAMLQQSIDNGWQGIFALKNPVAQTTEGDGSTDEPIYDAAGFVVKTLPAGTGKTTREKLQEIMNAN